MKDNKGYTLLEVMATVILLSLILGVMFKLNTQGMVFFSEAKRGADTSQNALIAYREIERQMKLSEAILIPSPGQSGSKLRLKQGPYIWDQLEFYYKSPSQVWMVKNQGHNPVAYGLNQINFFLNENGRTVEITIIATNHEGMETTYRGAVTLRR